MAFAEISEFKGYSSRRNLFATPIDIFRIMENTVIDQGQLVKRKAFKELRNINQGAIGGFKEFYFGGARAILTKQNASPFGWYLYAGSSLSTVTNFSATSGANAYPPSFVDYANVMYTCENTAISRKLFTISGTAAFERMGVPPPNTSYASPITGPVAHASQVSSLNWTAGTYAYAAAYRVTGDQVTWDSDIYEIGTYNLATPGTTLIPTISVTSASAAYNNHTISHIIFYRKNVTAGQTLYYKVATLAQTNGGATVFNDFSGAGDPLTQDTSAIGNTTHGYPTVTFRSLVAYKNRLLGYDNHGRLYISEVGFPDYIQETSYILVGDPYEAVKKLVVYADSCLIIKEQSVWSFTGTSWADFRVDQVLDIGSISINSIFIFNNSLYFVNDQGVYRWDIGQGKPVRISNDIDYDFESARSTIANSIIGYDPETGHVWVNLGGVYTYLFDPESGVWVGVFKHDYTPECWNTVGNFSGYKKKSAFILNSKLNSYNEESGISGTYETTMSISAVLGMKIDRSALQKLYKNIVLFDREGTWHQTSSTQSVSFTATLLSATTATALTSVTFNNTHINRIDIGKSDYGIAFGIQGTGINISPTWALWGFELEYEQVGVRR